MHWTDNFQRLVDICEESRSNNSACWMLTIKGSTHLSQTDFAVLCPRWMSLLMKTMVHPRRAIYLTVNTSLEFLNTVLPVEQTPRYEWPNEGILNTKPLTSETPPSNNKLTDKWTAARLRIPDELSLRVKRRFRRKPQATKTATDIYGNPLVGLINIMPDNDVWMHYSPSSDRVETNVVNSASLKGRCGNG
jgi:platelet-activating factor acetylhydrolase